MCIKWGIVLLGIGNAQCLRCHAHWAECVGAAVPGSL